MRSTTMFIHIGFSKCFFYNHIYMNTYPTERFECPTDITYSISCTVFVTNEERSLTYTPISDLSLSSKRFLQSLSKRSRISS